MIRVDAETVLVHGSELRHFPVRALEADVLTLPDDWSVPGDHHTDPGCPRNSDDPMGTPCTCLGES